MNYKIVIVNYCKSSLILRLLDQLNAQTVAPSSVCVIDNSPREFALTADAGRIDYSFLLDIQCFPENLGYAKACNLGAKGGGWDWVVLLNPDIEIHDVRLFERLIKKSQLLSGLGCAGVSQCNPDGSYEVVARRFPTFRAILGKRIPLLRDLFFGRQVAAYLDAYPNEFNSNAKPISVEWLQSSFLLIPRDAWQSCGGLDERYFVFMADTDFGNRCLKHGFKSWFFPQFLINADGVRSSGGGLFDIMRSRTIRIHIVDAIKYFVAHFF